MAPHIAARPAARCTHGGGGEAAGALGERSERTPTHYGGAGNCPPAAPLDRATMAHHNGGGQARVRGNESVGARKPMRVPHCV